MQFAFYYGLLQKCYGRFLMWWGPISTQRCASESALRFFARDIIVDCVKLEMSCIHMRRHIVVMCPHPPSWPVHRAIKCCVQSDVSRTAPSQVPDVKRGVMVWKPLVQPCIIYLGHKEFYWNIKPKISFTCHNQAFPRSKVRFEPIPFQIWSGIVKFFANQ